MSMKVNVVERQEEPQQDPLDRSAYKLGAVSLLGILILMGIRVAESRPECIEWNREVADLTQRAVETEQEFDRTEKAYLEKAEFHCDLTYAGRDPAEIKLDETSEFCDYKRDRYNGWWDTPSFSIGPNYPKGKIPERWRDETGKHVLHPHAKAAQKARDHFERTKADLSVKIAAKPLFCSTGR